MNAPQQFYVVYNPKRHHTYVAAKVPPYCEILMVGTKRECFGLVVTLKETKPQARGATQW